MFRVYSFICGRRPMNSAASYEKLQDAIDYTEKVTYDMIVVDQFNRMVYWNCDKGRDQPIAILGPAGIYQKRSQNHISMIEYALYFNRKDDTALNLALAGF